MATLTTYSELLTQLGEWLHRTDYTAQAPVWVTLAQNRINREVKSMAMETKSTSFSINAEYVNVPSDFLEARSFRITSTDPDVVLAYKTEDQMTSDHLTTGIPGYFCTVGTQFRFAPAPDATYTATLVYYAKPATLAVTSQETNSLFPTHADMYLYASLLAATAGNANDPRIPLWEQAYQTARDAVNAQANRARWGGNSMMQRPG